MRFLKIFLLAATVITNAHITTDAFAYATQDYCTAITANKCNNLTGCLWSSEHEGADMCQPCPAGSYCTVGTGNPIACTLGNYCPAGTSVQAACPAGYYCPNTKTKYDCQAGYFCPAGTTALTSTNSCPTTHPFSPGNATAKSQCYYQIPAGYEYDTTTNAHTSCHAGGYCPGAQMTYGTTKDEYGWTPCTTNGQDGRTITSPTGAQRPTQCYVICPTKTIDHGRQTAPNVNAAADSAGNYYYPTCTYTTTCDIGYHVSGSACTANTYTVKFNKGTKPENASGNIQHTGYAAIYSQTLTYDTAATLEPVRFSLTGWTFAHWCTNEIGDCGTKYTDGQTVENLTTANNGLIDLYPRWTPNLYTITLYQNNATTNGTETLYTKYDTGVYTDSARTKQMTSSANPITKPQQKYTVTLDPDGGNVSPTELTATYTFNGFYEKNPTELYINGDGYITSDGEEAAKTTANNTTWAAYWTVAQVELPTPTRTGYTFDKWKDGDKTASTLYNVYSDVTLEATWTPNTYTVEYRPNKPSNSTNSVSGATVNSDHTYDESKQLTTNGYKLIGYKFHHWNTQPDNSGTNYTDKASVTNLTSENGATVVLYAQWAKCAAGYYCPGDNTQNQCPTAFTSDVGADEITDCYLKTNITLKDSLNPTGVQLFKDSDYTDGQKPRLYYRGNQTQ